MTRLVGPDLELMGEPSQFRPNARSSRARTLSGMGKPSRSQTERYQGFERFLIRTALVRAEGFDEIRHISVTLPTLAVLIFGRALGPFAHAANQPRRMVTLALNSSAEVRAIHAANISHEPDEAERDKMAQEAVKTLLLTSASAALVLLTRSEAGDGDPESYFDAKGRPWEIEFARMRLQPVVKCVGSLLDVLVVGPKYAASVLDASNASPFKRIDRW